MRNNGWIEFQNVGILGVELVILGALSRAKITVVGHKLRFLRHLRLTLNAAIQGAKKAWTFPIHASGPRKALSTDKSSPRQSADIH